MSTPSRKPDGPRTHLCPGGCGRQVRDDLFACKPDWFRLRPALRSAVWAAWNNGDLLAHAAALTEARQWFRANPRQAPAPRPSKPKHPRLF